MIILGYSVEKRVRAGLIQGMAETGALYMEGFLAPHIQELNESGTLKEESKAKIQSLLTTTSLGRRVAVINVWDLQGNLLVSSDANKKELKLPDDYVSEVLSVIRSGGVVANFETGAHLMEMNKRNFPKTFFEIYGPLHAYNGNELVAIGEFYEFSGFIKAELDEFRSILWTSILFVTTIMTLLLMHVINKAKAIIKNYQEQLRIDFIRASALAKRNNVLRRIADRARLNAAVMNEEYLASIGIDIHDGPIQLLSLIMLKFPSKINRNRMPPKEFAAIQEIRKEIEPLVHLVISDLRNICSGLVLPEIERLSTTETLNLAVMRHQNQTGTKVTQDLSDLPEQLPRAFRVCAYRVVQEALNNAFKHAGGRNQRVLARQMDDMLEIAISNTGGVSQGFAPTKINHKQIGLRGMKSRIKALRGSLTIERLMDGGTEVRALLPLQK